MKFITILVVSSLFLTACGGGNGGNSGNCKDGTSSDAIGKQGACSSHGGVA